MARCALLALALLAVAAPPARGDGVPAGLDVGGKGVTARGIASRYVAHGRIVVRVKRHGGKLLAARTLSRRVFVPGVATDGDATGLSADGRTLIVAVAQEIPRTISEFIVLDARSLKLRATIRLRGDFTLDAIEPAGPRAYFIERRGARYRVRAYDLHELRLLPEPVVDPAEPEPMQGLPISRAMSRGGRWAYTLYGGAPVPHPFIHALDTMQGRAKCIDLDGVDRDDAMAMLLSVDDDGTIVLRGQDRAPVLTVDPRSWAVRQPRPAAPSDEGGGSWLLLLAGAAVVGLLAAVVRYNVRPYAAS